jgi:hypothetical protein
VFAFVNVVRDVGPVCAWVNLAARTVTFSQPLFVDDNDTSLPDPEHGYLADYDYSASPTVTASAPFAAVVALAETGTIPGSGAATQTAVLAAARATDNSYEIASYLRVDTDNASLLPASATILNARITLYTTTDTATGTANQPGFLRVGGWGNSGSTGGSLRGGATWSPDNILGGNAPISLGSVPRVNYVTEPLTVTADLAVDWLGIESLLPGRMRTGEVGFKLANPNDADYNSASAPLFVGTGANVPYFEVDYQIRDFIPRYPIETAPLIDAAKRRVFVYLSNYVFCVQYGSDIPGTQSQETRWVGASATANQNAAYHATWLVKSVGSIGARDGGNYVRNRTSAVLNFNLQNIFAINHGAANTSVDLAISKIFLNNTFGDSDQEDWPPILSTTEADTLVAGATPIASSAASRFMLIDPFAARVRGGDLLFYLAGTGRVYRVGTE